jgi:hypothetical protein
MNDGAWDKLIDAIDIKCGIDRHGKSERPLEDKPELTEQIQFIEFERDGSKYRLERITGPAIIDRKTHFTHRAGAANRIENIYDSEEKMHKIRLFQEISGEWEERPIDTLQLA